MHSKYLYIVIFLAISNSLLAQDKSRNLYFKVNSTFNFFNFYKKIQRFDNEKVVISEEYFRVNNNKFSPSLSIHTQKKNILEFEVTNLRISKYNQSFFDTLTKNKTNNIRSGNFLLGIRTSYNFNILPKLSKFTFTLGPSANLYFSYKKNYEYKGLLTNYQDIQENRRYFAKQNAIGIDLEAISKLGYNLDNKWHFEIACPFKLLNINYSSYHVTTLKGGLIMPPSFEYINYISKGTDRLNYQKQFYFQVSISYKI